LPILHIGTFCRSFVHHIGNNFIFSEGFHNAKLKFS
jgi:hypothetical protein